MEGHWLNGSDTEGGLEPNMVVFRSIMGLHLADPKGLVQHFGYNSPAVLAVLITCISKNRFGVTVGVRDKHSPTLRTTLFLSCTHGLQNDLSVRLKDCLGILNLISNSLLYMEPTAPAGAASREMER